MALLDGDDERIVVRAAIDALVFVLRGAPLGEPVVSHGPFVMNTGEKIYREIKNFQSGKMGRL